LFNKNNNLTAMIEKENYFKGYAGTGKSTVGEILCDKLGLKFISIGDYSTDMSYSHWFMLLVDMVE